jgi:hypothetical protein
MKSLNKFLLGRIIDKRKGVNYGKDKKRNVRYPNKKVRKLKVP